MADPPAKHAYDHRPEGPDPIDPDWFTVKTKKVQISTTTNTTLVAFGATDAYGRDGSEWTGAFIRVIFLFYMADTDGTDVRLTSEGSPETGSAHFPEMGGAVLNYNPSGWFDCEAGEDLGLEVDGGGNVGGVMGWVYAR